MILLILWKSILRGLHTGYNSYDMINGFRFIRYSSCKRRQLEKFKQKLTHAFQFFVKTSPLLIFEKGSCQLSIRDLRIKTSHFRVMLHTCSIENECTKMVLNSEKSSDRVNDVYTVNLLDDSVGVKTKWRCDANDTDRNYRKIKAALKSTLPKRSQQRYIGAYGAFMEWMKLNSIGSFEETVVAAYFSDLAPKYAPTTLWSNYSMLKRMLICNHNVNIKSYSQLISFLKTIADGYECKNSKVFSAAEVKRFIDEAPDDRFLATKVVLIFGVIGACRGDEITNILHELSQWQTFKASDLQKYHCENAEIDSRISAASRTLVIATDGHIGAEIQKIKRPGQWKSASVAEGYIQESLGHKRKVSNLITSAINHSAPKKFATTTVMKNISVLSQQISAFSQDIAAENVEYTSVIESATFDARSAENSVDIVKSNASGMISNGG
ncbi:hypothetical protein Bhyg_00422 [Pseudolycoriella hygida]|uniref:Uncharacterized protein n=1 Tax=Pseudolycoriella hygida TaxID=35572 RepID=A0A9Q0S5W7_9DIPT|nr:hypothetical protein Bhyg_00422 [Pseudolycoriella hygida]